MQSSKTLCSLPKPYLRNRLKPCPLQSTCLPFFRMSPKQPLYKMKMSITFTLACVTINVATEMYEFDFNFNLKVLLCVHFLKLLNKIITSLVASSNNKNWLFHSLGTKSSESRGWQSPDPSLGGDRACLPSSSSFLGVVNLSWWLQVTLDWGLCRPTFSPLVPECPLEQNKSLRLISIMRAPSL